MLRLEVFDGPDKVGELEVQDAPVAIGRDASNSFVLKDPSVSLRHAVLEPWGRFTFIRDQGSETGTYLNGKPVAVDIVEVGNRIRIGRFTLHATALEPARSEKAGPQDAAPVGTASRPKPPDGASPAVPRPCADDLRRALLLGFARRLLGLATGLDGDLALLRPAVDEGTSEAEALVRFEKGFQDLCRISEGLLEFAEMEVRDACPGRQFLPAGVRKLLRRAIEAAREVARPRRIAISERTPDGLPDIRAQGERLEAAFRHVLASLVDLSGEGAAISIEAAVEEGSLRIRFFVEGAPDLEKVVREALGGGIERSSSGKSSFDALRLALARQILIEHGSDLLLEGARKGGGSVLTATFPGGTLMDRHIEGSPSSLVRT